MKRGMDCGVTLGRTKDPDFWRDRRTGARMVEDAGNW